MDGKRVKMKIKRFEDLDIWKASIEITKEIYDMTARKNFSVDFELKGQIKRSVISISSNIVEGFEKNNNNEFIRFLKISKGSSGEVRNQLYIALAVKYITEDEFIAVNKKLEDLAGQIGKFIVYLEQQRKNGNFKTR